MPHLPRMWGVEIECGGGRVDHGNLYAQFVAAGIPAESPTGYSNRATQGWRIGTDSSISLSPQLELASPPSTNTDILAPVLKILRDARYRTNESCGLHVHVDMAHGTQPRTHETRRGIEGDIVSLDVLRRLAKLWIKYETYFYDLAGPERISNHFSSPVGFGRRDGLGMKELFNAIDQAHCAECLSSTLSHGERGKSMNLAALWRHGTVEFRMHGGTLDTDTITNWITLLVYLVELAHLPGTRLLPTRGSMKNLQAALMRVSDSALPIQALFDMGDNAVARRISGMDHARRKEYIDSIGGATKLNMEARSKAYKAAHDGMPAKCLVSMDSASKARRVAVGADAEPPRPEPAPARRPLPRAPARRAAVRHAFEPIFSPIPIATYDVAGTAETYSYAPRFVSLDLRTALTEAEPLPPAPQTDTPGAPDTQ